MTLKKLVTKWRVENRSYPAVSNTPHLLLTPQEIDEAIAAFVEFLHNGGSYYLAPRVPYLSGAQSVCKHCQHPIKACFVGHDVSEFCKGFLHLNNYHHCEHKAGSPLTEPAPQTSAEQCNQSDRAWPCPKCGLRNNSACDHKYHTKSTPQPVSVDAPPNEDPWGKVFSEEIRDSKDPIVRLADSIVYGFAIVTPHTKDNLGLFSNETYVKEVRSVVEKLRRYFPPASQTPLGLFVSARLKKLNQSHLGFDQICELISDLLATPASTINITIHGTHSPANTDRCICKEAQSKPRPESYMICGRTLTEIRSLVQQDEIRKTLIPSGSLELHVRISKAELKPLISDELAEQCKPGEHYATVVENLFANAGVKSALVMRVYGDKEG